MKIRADFTSRFSSDAPHGTAHSSHTSNASLSGSAAFASSQKALKCKQQPGEAIFHSTALSQVMQLKLGHISTMIFFLLVLHLPLAVMGMNTVSEESTAALCWDANVPRGCTQWIILTVPCTAEYADFHLSLARQGVSSLPIFIAYRHHPSLRMVGESLQQYVFSALLPQSSQLT
ncbi:unnamed protein product [Vitrella brassicaformis CCMP3155]|uniref:Uncharacterized protein n=1 Tax=Vitrella brassicaformis (strain CCMP3155) TaxID=1169540 RepID=A0A0G4EWD6_VITBC|nr:unnamed protein product [Vitrella brassicaformis CCMP3155]|eukprot:CEM02768.1 unnamed protein product [Vitrella brassicaformis CCMP3155]